MVQSKDGLLSLWASHGAADALSPAPAIRRLVMPGSRRLDIVTVAPVSRAFSRRMVHWTAEQRAPDMDEARSAAQRSMEALGPTEIPSDIHLRWGIPSRELTRQAEEDRVDLLVLGAGARSALHRAVLGTTAENVLGSSTRSVFVAREPEAAEDSPVILLYSVQPWFANSLSMFQALRLPPHIPARVTALLEPVKPLGGMFLSFSESIRERRQIGHDAQKEILESHLANVAARLSEFDGRTVETLIRDCEPRDTAKVVEELHPQLVVVGDQLHADPATSDRRVVAHLAASLSCSVLVAR